MAGKKATDKKESSWIGEIEKYSRQIWLAGLGAYSKVSKDGSKVFEALVKDGEKAEKQAKTEVEGAVKTSARSAKSRVDAVKGAAIGKWGELEEAFDRRLNSAISRLGIPSSREVKDLHSKVDSLTRQIEKLTGVSVKSTKPAAKPAVKTAASKPATRAAKPAAKPAAKKPAAPKATKPAAAKPAGTPTPSAAGPVTPPSQA